MIYTPSKGSMWDPSIIWHEGPTTCSPCSRSGCGTQSRRTECTGATPDPPCTIRTLAGTTTLRQGGGIASGPYQKPVNRATGGTLPPGRRARRAVSDPALEAPAVNTTPGREYAKFTEAREFPNTRRSAPGIRAIDRKGLPRRKPPDRPRQTRNTLRKALSRAGHRARRPRAGVLHGWRVRNRTTPPPSRPPFRRERAPPMHHQRGFPGTSAPPRRCRGRSRQPSLPFPRA